jgi:hypothetical protein
MKKFCVLCSLLLSIGAICLRGATPRFFPDDPITVDVETQDASKVVPQDLSDPYDFLENTFLNPADRADIRALNVNTFDEVPDSSWWTNRILHPFDSAPGKTPMTAAEIARGPITGNGPVDGIWTIVGSKNEGITPGFTITDETGQLYFIKFDPLTNPEMATGAEAVTTPLFHALGYHVVENYIATLRRENLRIGPKARLYREFSGTETPLTEQDIDALLRKVAQSADGTYRVIASKAATGRPLGPFRYYGMRPDDPNDVFAHEHRRELRAMRVFAAWLNHDDSRSINSGDFLTEQNGRKVVRHHLLDFGSTLGSGSTQAQKPRAGNEYIWEARPTLLTMVTLGFYVRPWIKVEYPDLPSVGRFEGAFFQPQYWKPEYPNPAFDNARADDLFWAARRVAAFSDEAIRETVKNGRYSARIAELYMGDVIIVRRDKIARYYLNITNPVVDFALEDGVMTFKNAAVDLRYAQPAEHYQVSWARFDNATGNGEPVGDAVTVKDTRADVPRELLNAEYIRAIVTSHHPQQANWVHPVHVFFRKQGNTWKTVGLERIIPPRES